MMSDTGILLGNHLRDNHVNERGYGGSPPENFWNFGLKWCDFGALLTNLPGATLTFLKLIIKTESCQVPGKFCQVPSQFAKCQIWHLAPNFATLYLWPTTLTYNSNLAEVKVDPHIKYQCRRTNSSCRGHRQTNTHTKTKGRTDATKCVISVLP